jgi:hypothetical protein
MKRITYTPYSPLGMSQHSNPTRHNSPYAQRRHDSQSKSGEGKLQVPEIFTIFATTYIHFT